jgi:hypothetical protein
LLDAYNNSLVAIENVHKDGAYHSHKISEILCYLKERNDRHNYNSHLAKEKELEGIISSNQLYTYMLLWM